jgi:hypothetical protein
MDTLEDVITEKKKYTEFTINLRFTDGKRKKRTVEKACKFSLAFDYDTLNKVALKYGDVMEGFRKFDESWKSIQEMKATPDAFECIKSFVLMADPYPTCDGDELEVTAEDLGSADFEDIKVMVAGVLTAVSEAMAKKKPIAG